MCLCIRMKRTDCAIMFSYAVCECTARSTTIMICLAEMVERWDRCLF